MEQDSTLNLDKEQMEIRASSFIQSMVYYSQIIGQFHDIMGYKIEFGFWVHNQPLEF